MVPLRQLDMRKFPGPPRLSVDLKVAAFIEFADFFLFLPHRLSTEYNTVIVFELRRIRKGWNYYGKHDETADEETGES